MTSIVENVLTDLVLTTKRRRTAFVLDFCSNLQFSIKWNLSISIVQEVKVEILK